MKVLFTHSYFYRFDKKQWNNRKPYPPLATITAAAFLREASFDVSLFDVGLKTGPADLKGPLEETAPDVFVIYDDGFNYLTKMCLTSMRHAAFEMIKMAKAANCLVIVSSSDATDHSESYLNEGADFVVYGEGELTLRELLTTVREKKSCEEIRGLRFLKNSKVHDTGARPVLRDLDSIPMAAWDLVDIEAYKSIWMNAHGRFSLNLATTRGCPFKCNWCAKPIYGNRYNSRSPQKVVEEIEFLTNNYGVQHFWMCDDIFGLKPGWVQQFSEETQRKGLHFKFLIQSRADLLIENDNIRAMVDAGLEEAWIGAESGSQKILDAMDKGTTISQIEKATRSLKRYKVRIGFFIQFGYLQETEQDIHLTHELIKQLMPDDIGISVSYPLPGTKFYENVKRDLSQKANWTDSDDLDLMFNSTYPSAYYKKLHRYTHKMFRAHQGLIALGEMFKIRRQDNSSFKRVLMLLYYLPATALDFLILKRLKTQ